MSPGSGFTLVGGEGSETRKKKKNKTRKNEEMND